MSEKVRPPSNDFISIIEVCVVAKEVKTTYTVSPFAATSGPSQELGLTPTLVMSYELTKPEPVHLASL